MVDTYEKKEELTKVEQAKQDQPILTVELTGEQRLLLLGILPHEGRSAELRAVEPAVKHLVLGDDEIRSAGADPDVGGLTRRQAQALRKTFTWSGETLRQIKRHVKAKEEAGKLPMELLHLFELMCE